VAKWSVGDTMEREREAFGFYFAGHPISQFAQIAESHGAKSYAETINCGHIAEGSRKSGTMAAMVQAVRWRESKRGKRFVQAEFSDAGGQYQASCFEETTCADLAEWAKTSECLLLNIEMDLPPGEEIPRIAVRSAKPLSGLVANTQFKMLLDIEREDAFMQLQGLILPLGGGRGEVVVRTRAADGKTADITIGRKFRLDVELVEKVKGIEGVGHVALEPIKRHLESVR
jgi:DNA polymerase III subunit alpha